MKELTQSLLELVSMIEHSWYRIPEWYNQSRWSNYSAFAVQSPKKSTKRIWFISKTFFWSIDSVCRLRRTPSVCKDKKATTDWHVVPVWSPRNINSAGWSSCPKVFWWRHCFPIHNAMFTTSAVDILPRDWHFPVPTSRRCLAGWRLSPLFC